MDQQEQEEEYDGFNEEPVVHHEQSQSHSEDAPLSRPHSLSSVVDVDHPNHPQPQDYYMPLSNLLPVRRAMLYVPVTFIHSNRCTFSDVMSVSNSARVTKEKKNKYNTSHRVRFPYADSSQFKSMAGGIDEKHMTMLERKLNQEARTKRNRELHEERRLFMERLKVEREQRSAIESAAVIQIQKITRGFLKRPRSDYTLAVKESREASRFLMNAKSKLTSDLLEMTEIIGLPPIPGMTLDSKKMIEQQRQEHLLKLRDDQAKASVQIQSCIRQRIGTKRVNEIRRIRHEEKIRLLAIKIQKSWRGMVGKRIYKKMVWTEQSAAITFIQNRIRMKRARLQSEALRKAKSTEKRRMFAAIKVQSMWRGKVSRRSHVCQSYEKKRLLFQRKSMKLGQAQSLPFDLVEEKKEEVDWLEKSKKGELLENVLSEKTLTQFKAEHPDL